MPGLRFYFDEDSLDQDVVAALRRSGIDVETAIDAQMLERSDEEQFAHARAEGRLIYTANVGDFARLHGNCVAAGGTHPGIVLRTWQRMPVGTQVRVLISLETRVSPLQARDQLLYLGEFAE